MTTPTMTDAQPLKRLGSYLIEEKPWHNPKPERGLGGEALGRYWLGLLEHHQRMWAARDRPCDRPEEAGTQSRIEYRSELKVEIKTYEAVLALLHGIIAPDSPFLCDHGCPLVAAGMTPEQLKRFLDALDAFGDDSRKQLERNREYQRTKPYSPTDTYERDMDNQIYEVERCRRNLWKIWQEQ